MNYSQNHAEQEVPCPKMSAKTKITFSIHNSVAKPVIGRSSSSPEKTTTVRLDIASGRNPYGRWVPVKARSFPLSASKRSTTKSR
ncbi:hypothetical protein SKAU_G00420230 [Synaphobranchus kaupii]|uniref:Uncharacterized protein n=1 Tax=Synaphobranchus kaupii TaxID=118154 RepID=A0A9Q1E6K7_SYNKA|nr:hypothetical protein SKAU_G00420230 [Synaphobranchus kaupii]